MSTPCQKDWFNRGRGRDLFGVALRAGLVGFARTGCAVSPLTGSIPDAGGRATPRFGWSGARVDGLIVGADPSAVTLPTCAHGKGAAIGSSATDQARRVSCSSIEVFFGTAPTESSRGRQEGKRGRRGIAPLRPGVERVGAEPGCPSWVCGACRQASSWAVRERGPRDLSWLDLAEGRLRLDRLAATASGNFLPLRDHPTRQVALGPRFTTPGDRSPGDPGSAHSSRGKKAASRHPPLRCVSAS